MSGYDTHHADLAQTAGVETWSTVIACGVIGVCVVVIALVLMGRAESRQRRYDRDHARQQMHADRTQGETFPERVQRINGEGER